MELCTQCLSRKCFHQKNQWITLNQLEEQDFESDCDDYDSGLGDDSPPQTPNTPNDEGKITLWYRIIVTSRLFFLSKKIHPLLDPSRLLILAIHLSVRQIIFDYVY